MLQEGKTLNHIVVIPLSTKFRIQMKFLGATNSQETIILPIFERHLADYLPVPHSGQVFQFGIFWFRFVALLSTENENLTYCDN